MKLGTSTNSMTNYLMSGTRGQPKPEVGMGATVLMWTDRKAATITQVSKSGKRIAIQQDKAVRVDGNGMSECQEYRFERDESRSIEWFSMRKNGAFVRCGDSANGTQIRIGERDEYHDYSF
jgi:hypothetical protein